MCYSVFQWAVDHPGTEVQRLIPAARGRLPAPNTLEATVPDELSEKWAEYAIPEKYLARVPDARLHHRGLVVLPDGSIAVESVRPPFVERAASAPLATRAVRK